jgi:hypothetical protein
MSVLFGVSWWGIGASGSRVLWVSCFDRWWCGKLFWSRSPHAHHVEGGARQPRYLGCHLLLNGFQIQQPNFFSLETSCELRFVYAHQFGKRHSPMLFRSDSQIVMCFCKLCWRVRSHKLCCNECKYWHDILRRKHLKPSSCTIWFPAFPLICNQNVGWALQSHRCMGFLSDLTILDPITCDQLPHFLQASNIKVKWIVQVSTFAIYSEAGPTL